MSLISKLKNEVEAFGLQFLYDSAGGINRMIDNADYTEDKCVVYSFLLSQSQFIDGKETAQIGVFFSKLTDFDFDSIENDAIQQACKEIAFEFIKYLAKGNVFTVGAITLNYFYDEFEANLTGVAVNTTFTETVGLCQDTVYFNKPENEPQP
ncbi:hypothetical protein UFOVP756_8 [uncultured Caudovirales phage]|jgi:hypothetical protein|uniref:Uncharacterized protein n=1 Tax=uncultured Caudovirales phage TaxID=2100421 RepID=A0A6J7X5F5_9CAUD|nr:hypothetical protein UFOVP756_8 [uncultured Caudovirales phage]